jgi:hypothetical protein
MAPINADWQTAPSSPLPPKYPMPTTQPADFRRVCVVDSAIAVPSDDITDVPLNLSAAGTPTLLMRDILTGQALAFDRHVQFDLIPRFAKTSDARRPTAVMVDIDTDTEWSVAGQALQGSRETRGRSLTPMIAEDGLYWDVMKFWLPDLKSIDTDTLAAAVTAPPSLQSQQQASRGQNRRRRASQ